MFPLDTFISFGLNIIIIFLGISKGTCTDSAADGCRNSAIYGRDGDIGYKQNIKTIIKTKIKTANMETKFEKKRVYRKDVKVGGCYLINGTQIVLVDWMEWVDNFLNVSGMIAYTNDRMSWYKRGVVVMPGEKMFTIYELGNDMADYLLTIRECAEEMKQIISENFYFARYMTEDFNVGQVFKYYGQKDVKLVVLLRKFMNPVSKRMYYDFGMFWNGYAHLSERVILTEKQARGYVRDPGELDPKILKAARSAIDRQQAAVMTARRIVDNAEREMMGNVVQP